MVAASSREGQGDEALLLTEMGYDTGVFTGDVDFTLGSFNARPGNSAIDVLQGDVITISYDDQYPGVVAHTVVRIASTGQLSIEPSPISVGYNVNITVIDVDLNVTLTLQPKSYTLFHGFRQV